jgi:hypothetical protein
MSNPPDKRRHLNRDAIRALFWIILTALVGIILLALWGVTLRAGLLSDNVTAETASQPDEALSILGNIAAAAVGGLVGWLTRDYQIVRGDSEGDDDDGLA